MEPVFSLAVRVLSRLKPFGTFNLIDILTVKSIYASVKFDYEAERAKNKDSRLYKVYILYVAVGCIITKETCI